jgi:hypothetical protein
MPEQGKGSVRDQSEQTSLVRLHAEDTTCDSPPQVESRSTQGGGGIPNESRAASVAYGSGHRRGARYIANRGNHSVRVVRKGNFHGLQVDADAGAQW